MHPAKEYLIKFTKFAKIRKFDAVFCCSYHCFRLVNFKVNFNQAARYCKEREGVLAFADSEETWNTTIEFLKGRGFLDNEIWTGVQKVIRKEELFWAGMIIIILGFKVINEWDSSGNGQVTRFCFLRLLSIFCGVGRCL